MEKVGLGYSSVTSQHFHKSVDKFKEEQGTPGRQGVGEATRRAAVDRPEGQPGSFVGVPAALESRTYSATQPFHRWVRCFNLVLRIGSRQCEGTVNKSVPANFEIFKIFIT